MMDLEPGAWVRTQAGEVGQIVTITKMSAFVKVEGEPAPENVRLFLLSELTRVDPPHEPKGPSGTQ
jgi:hypothetical protein